MTESEKYQELWAGVLKQAIIDLTDNEEVERRRAKWWFKRKQDNVGSFIWICNLFNMPHEMTLAKIFSSLPVEG